MKKTEMSLWKRLKKYDKTAIPMHMPGHKRNTALLGKALPYSVDITEIDGFDNLHDMCGILKETATLASSLYGSLFTFPLINGTSCGILAAIHTLCPFGGHILMARNCHKSVYNAVALRRLTPHYLLPEKDEFGIFQKISPLAVKEALEKTPSISLVVLTSPTYEGVVSDVAGIADVCRAHGVRLLIDAAHGAHLGFSPNGLASPVSCGADVVVMSLHKTMPALTQTALLHICSEEVSKKAIAEALSIYETSSPSYVLLSSVDRCLRLIAKKKKTLFQTYEMRLSRFYKKTKSLQKLSVVRYDDAGKIVVSTKNANITATSLAAVLRKQYHIEVEMVGNEYLLAMTSICDKEKHINAFARALLKIDRKLSCPPKTKNQTADTTPPLPEMVAPPHTAMQKANLCVSLEDAIGQESAEYIWAYPPGIPLIVPGERVSPALIKEIRSLRQQGISLKSTNGQVENSIYITKETKL